MIKDAIAKRWLAEGPERTKVSSVSMVNLKHDSAGKLGAL